MKVQQIRGSDVAPRNMVATLNVLVDAINQMSGITGGPGIQVKKTAGGISIIGTGTQGRSRASSTGTGNEAGPTVLGQTQGTQDTDTWDLSSDGTPVEVECITDIEYDTTDHKLYYRTRTWLYNDLGQLAEISAESARVEITEAVACVDV